MSEEHKHAWWETTYWPDWVFILGELFGLSLVFVSIMYLYWWFTLHV